MAKIRIYEPQAISYGITIAVPITKPIVDSNVKNISYWENFFSRMRDNVDMSNRKMEYDRCRALLKWASTCNASLVIVKNSNDESGQNINFTFSFDNLDTMLDFSKNFKTEMNGSIL